MTLTEFDGIKPKDAEYVIVEFAKDYEVRFEKPPVFRGVVDLSIFAFINKDKAVKKYIDHDEDKEYLEDVPDLEKDDNMKAFVALVFNTMKTPYPLKMIKDVAIIDEYRLSKKNIAGRLKPGTEVLRCHMSRIFVNIMKIRDIDIVRCDTSSGIKSWHVAISFSDKYISPEELQDIYSCSENDVLRTYIDDDQYMSALIEALPNDTLRLKASIQADM